MKSACRSLLLLACICTMGLTGAAFAAINPVNLPGVTCPSNLNSCTANDVTTVIQSVTILNVCYHEGAPTSTPCTSDANCDPGDTCAGDICESTTDNILLQITTAYASTSAQKFDLGLFVSKDGGTVQEPSTAVACAGSAAQAGQGDNLAYPDADTDLFLSLDPNGHSDTPNITDTCGDLMNTAGPVNWTTIVSVRCNIVGGNLIIPA